MEEHSVLFLFSFRANRTRSKLRNPEKKQRFPTGEWEFRIRHPRPRDIERQPEVESHSHGKARSEYDLIHSALCLLRAPVMQQPTDNRDHNTI